MDATGAQFAQRWELEGEPLTADQLAGEGQRLGGSVGCFVGGPKVRQWARPWRGHKIPSSRHGPFPLLCWDDGPIVLANLQRVAIVQIPPRSGGPGAPLGGAGWRFRLAVPAVDPDLVASELQINLLGGKVIRDPDTGELLIGAHYRDAQTGHWHLDRCLHDAEAFGFDLQGEFADSIRDRIIRRSGGAWSPPTTDPETIARELSQQERGAPEPPTPRRGAAGGRPPRPCRLPILQKFRSPLIRLRSLRL